MSELNYFLPIVPIVIGVGGQFLPFIDSRKEFRDRVSLRRESLFENLAEFLEDLLGHFRSIQDTDDPLRGQPDLVKRYTKETWRVFDALAQIARLKFWFTFGYLVLFLATMVALAIALGLFLAPQKWPLLRDATVSVAVIQLLAITGIYWACNRFEKYEQSQ